MNDYPLDRQARAGLRAKRREEYLARAERDAELDAMSHNCRERTIHGTHPTKDPGCLNTGVGCLCWCHDRRSAAEALGVTEGDPA